MTRLEVGDTAPVFTAPAVMPNGNQTDFSLADALADALAQTQRGLIVYFYPAAMTPGCTKQACDFRDSLASLTSAGYSIVGVSPDAPAKLAKFIARDSLTFPLASDLDHTIAAAYGAWGEKTMYGITRVGLIRSTIVIAPNGTVALAQYNVKATGHVARLRTALGL